MRPDARTTFVIDMDPASDQAWGEMILAVLDGLCEGEIICFDGQAYLVTNRVLLPYGAAPTLPEVFR